MSGLETEIKVKNEAEQEERWNKRERSYSEKRDETGVIEFGIVDYTIHFLQSAPPLCHQLHRLLVPDVHPSL